MPHACTSPEHHVHDGAAFVAEVERQCVQRKLRLTAIRASALQLIADAGRPIKAYDLLDLMRATHGTAAPPTVYRALEFLLEHGFIHKLSSVNAFVACHHPGSAAHAVPFLICDICHSATELEDERIVEMLDARARALGFEPRVQTLEVHGTCSDCGVADSSRSAAG